MFWRSWNKADKTLLFAAVVFFLALEAFSLVRMLRSSAASPTGSP